MVLDKSVSLIGRLSHSSRCPLKSWAKAPVVSERWRHGSAMPESAVWFVGCYADAPQARSAKQ